MKFWPNLNVLAYFKEKILYLIFIDNGPNKFSFQPRKNCNNDPLPEGVGAGWNTLYHHMGYRGKICANFLKIPLAPC